MATYTVTKDVWTRIALAGSTVEVENASPLDAVYIMTSSGAPDPSDIGIVLKVGDDDRVRVLTLDLWARAATNPVSIVVMGGFSVSSGSSGSSSGSTTTVNGYASYFFPPLTA